MARGGNRSTSSPGRFAKARPQIALALLLVLLVPLAGGCRNPAEARHLAGQARELWESGNYDDAARNLVTLAELYPGSPLAEESLLLAASLYHYFLHDPVQASRHYQNLIVSYPKGRYFYEAKENLAALYEEDPESRHRALQIYQQMLLAKELAERRDYLRLKIGQLNMQLGKMDRARLEFREILLNHPRSSYRGRSYYLVAYSYYLEKRYDLALIAFNLTAREFAGTPVAMRARFFVADTLEEQGEMRKALKAFKALQTRYPNPDIVDKRIKSLEARIRRGVR